MRLTVLNVGYPLALVSESTAGGAEQVLAMLDEALVGAGHRSLVIAPEGSQVRGHLLPIPESGRELNDEVHAVAILHQRAALRSALARFSVDVVHMHGIDFLNYLPDEGVPVLVTLHLPPSWYPPAVFHLTRPNTYLVCVSHSQARGCPAEANIRAIVPNGVRLEQFRPGRRKRDYVMSMGRICPEKGFHLALDAARRSGISLFLAGNVFGYASHQNYFDEQIRPRLVGGHRFLGEIGPTRKRHLLAGARCLLAPSLVSETSSLVAMEALASGTPVVALPKGALVELIQHGHSGFLVNTVDEMVDAIRATEDVDPAVCRQEAETRFSAGRMCQLYLTLYGRAGTAPVGGRNSVSVSEAVR
jgi:glycosyltransferase involved in cell wall biosynthesis